MKPDDATQRQIDAATPNQSTWLSANAGSGKTRVLTDRVARLLLDEVPPENVLCLTYTKAAASEMQNRLFQRLGEWAMMPKRELRKQLKELGTEAVIDDAYLSRARTLFASAIETPGGLKIQTIHSFCAGILRRFPLEAAVSPQFKEMEDRAAQLLREEVLDDMAAGDHAVAVAGFARHYTGAEVGKFLASISSHKAGFLSPPTDAKLVEIFDLPDGATIQDAVNIAFIGGEDDLADDLADALKSTTATYIKFTDQLKALNLKSPDIEALNGLFSMFLYAADHTSKSRNWPQSNHKKAVDAVEHLTDDVHAWMDRTEAAFQFVQSVNALDKARALFAFATPFVTAYELKKTQRAVLDFDDQISKAKALLEDPAVAQWVLFRLDGGVDHVLVDEAQDTSPDQWDIVRLLTQEFSTGVGAHPDRERTVFVVGDKKQSIYSFQGADPEGFDRMSEYFKGELANVGKQLYPRELLYSFRSSAAILQLVDQTFQGVMAEGLGDHIEHLAFKDDMPGRVDVWPVIEKSESPEDREWDDPIDVVGAENHKVKLAAQVASEIKRMIATETLPVKGKKDTEWKRRKITPGDFLILVQGRTTGIFNEIIAACKSAELDIAGADRLKLGGELAVKDISALLQFLALQDDDLSLAAALKSPLFGWSEKQLYDLAQPRKKGMSLWEALRTSGQHSDTMAVLSDLRDKTDFLRPYDLINRLLIRHHGRHNLIARLGHEAEDGIDALLSQALGYEQSAVPSLTGFLTWLQTEEVTVKRQMDTASDRIRVMTVHGAKGLESPIVILPETTKRDRKGGGEIINHDGVPLWKPNKPQMPQVMLDMNETVAAANERERRRLLYVALTRAENWLIVAAAGDTGKEPEDSWHGTVSAALGHLDAVDHAAPFGPIKRFSRHDWDGGELQDIAKVETPKPVLANFGDTLADIPARAKTRAPSDLGGAKIMTGDVDPDSGEVALAYGNIIHHLLEILPDVPHDTRRATAERLANNHAEAGLIPDIDTLIDEALNTLDEDSLSWVFASGLAEVPISANLPELGNDRLHGIIDRLIVTDTDVIAVDYKSNRLVPQTPDQTPDGLVRQLAAYRDALKQIYPTHRIRTLLLWTKTRTTTELDDTALVAALARVTTS